LLVLFMLALWLAAAIWIARRVARLIPVRPKWRPVVAIGLFLLVFFLPVADELAARPSFNYLCRTGAVLKIDAEKIKGRNVILSANDSDGRMKGMLIPVFHSHFEYRDAISGEVLGEYEMYIGEGGLLARTVGLASAHPITGPFFCAPEDRLTAKQRYGFTILK
jgi:hypothetical protein